MEKLIDRIETIIDQQLTAWEHNPVRTSLKFLVYYWLFKKVYSYIKEK